MAPSGFTPPTYVETRHVVFDKRTGEIVATETRWTIRGARASPEPAVGPELLESLAAQAAKRVSDLDVLHVKKARPGAMAVRVDVRRRVLIVAKPPRGTARDAHPGKAGPP